MRKCVVCLEEKELELFRKRQIWFSHTCKKCYSQSYASGKPNIGRFVKGHTPWIKGKKNVPKRDSPKYVKKGREVKNLPSRRAKWGLDVKTRDGFKCQQCGREDNVQAHHIVKWKSDESLRFELSNGITLCKSCHARTERLLETAMGLPASFIRGKKW